MKKTGRSSCLALGVGVSVLASSLFWSTPVMAYDYSFSGESNTILRMRKTADKATIIPAYEYLRLNMTDNRSDGSGVSFYLGAWGRGDLADKDLSTTTNPDGDLQYAYLTYRAPKNNTVTTIGRQFISEGVASERIDGLYVRSDFAYGIGVATFFGNTVITQRLPQPAYQGGTLIYGARISQSDKKYYSVGLSALKGAREGDGRYREEEGVDLWLRPIGSVDLNGRSSYNSITDGWMEHSYALSYSPLSSLRLGVDYSSVNLKDYLANVTTSALSFLNPILNVNNRQNVVGASATYTGIKNLTLGADYKHYNYDHSGSAAYFGGKASYSFPEELVVGCAVHRMDGGVNELRYNEYRAYAAKKIAHTDLTIDATNTNYDKEISGIKNSYAITGAVGYEINRKLKIGADMEFSRNPDFSGEVRGLVKATYTFDTKFAAEGGTKSEK